MLVTVPEPFLELIALLSRIIYDMPEPVLDRMMLVLLSPSTRTSVLGIAGIQAHTRPILHSATVQMAKSFEFQLALRSESYNASPVTRAEPAKIDDRDSTTRTHSMSLSCVVLGAW